jgi:hypothetical protein
LPFALQPSWEKTATLKFLPELADSWLRLIFGADQEENEMDKGKVRFGTIAINKGYITKDQLIRALTIQAQENIEKGTHRLLGQILLSEGYLSPEQVDEIVELINNQMVYMLSVGR